MRPELPMMHPLLADQPSLGEHSRNSLQVAVVSVQLASSRFRRRKQVAEARDSDSDTCSCCTASFSSWEFSCIVDWRVGVGKPSCLLCSWLRTTWGSHREWTAAACQPNWDSPGKAVPHGELLEGQTLGRSFACPLCPDRMTRTGLQSFMGGSY